MNETLAYFLLRIALFPLSFLPYRAIHGIGRALGPIAYHLCSKYRKRTLSNLALAKDLALDPKAIRKYAKRSFANLIINLLEYPRFGREKDFSRVISCQNPEVANRLFREGQGIIFFCGHQANWETLFLEGNTHLKGVAIAKPIRNRLLYRWIVRIREKTGGKIIPHTQALKKGIKALRAGLFLGILGDQGMPEASFSFPFLGRKAFSSPAPALLSYKTGAPIIVATAERHKGRYIISYSAPIWPDKKQPIEKEMARLMNYSLSLLQESIHKNIGEWLWQHNRWKQLTPHRVYKKYRHDSILAILPQEKEEFEKVISCLPLLKEIYGSSFLMLLAPSAFIGAIPIKDVEILPYNCLKETLLKDYRFKLVLNFTEYAKIKKHFLRLSAFKVLTMPKNDLETYLKREFCRKGTI